MGAGPLRLIADPALAEFSSVTIDTPDASDPEIVRIAEADRRLAQAVHTEAADDAFPVVLAGNCNSCLGTVAGLDASAGSLGVVWFDAHADFDTPDRSLGFFDAMGLAILAGHGWDLLRTTIPVFTPVAESDVVLVGVRDLEPHQRAPLEASAMRLPADSTELTDTLDGLRLRAPRVYLHVDLDVLDPSEGRANRFAAEGGLTLSALESAIDLVFARFEVAAAAITAYDPGLDEDGRVARAALRVLAAVTGGAS